MKFIKMKENGIKHVLKVNGVPHRMINNFSGVHIKVVDMDDQIAYKITDEDLRECFSHMDTCEQCGSPPKTLVVCTAGRSRSATVCIAYLMWK